ncbi:MAG: T9SS type A sorting domain-containing protein [Cyclobacteriaceae bacterium]|nr:T9SS type A sorting domain-containing protein [Cyclobacteriaceae bacterium HetDA_MAG_MS6]
MKTITNPSYGICLFFFLVSFITEASSINVESLCGLNPRRHRWEVSNTSDERIKVNYQILPGGSLRKIWINPGESKTISRPVAEGTTLQTTIGDETQTFEADTSICYIDGIEFTSVCADNPFRRRWRVRNPNNFSVYVEFEVYGKTEKKGLWLPKAGKGVEKWDGDGVLEYKFFTTKAFEGSNTTKIYYGDNQQKTKASCNCICPLPEGSVTVSSKCSDRRNRYLWQVNNLNDKKIWVQLSTNGKWTSVPAAVPDPASDEGPMFIPGTKNIYTNTDSRSFSVTYGDDMESNEATTNGPCIDIDPGIVFDPHGIYYIDNTTDMVYSVDLTDGSGPLANLTALFQSPYGGTHMSLNTNGDRLYLVQGGGKNRYGYLDLNTKEYFEVGALHLGAIYQVTFSPHGEMYFAANRLNEVMVMADPESGEFESFGKVKIDNSDEFIKINGADMAFDEDGTFYVATHQGKKIYTVSGVKDHLLAVELSTTDGKLATGLAVLQSGTGDLIFSAKGQTAMTVVNVNTQAVTEYALSGDLSVMGWGDMTTGQLDFRERCNGYASNVLFYGPGSLASLEEGSMPPAERRDINNALGAPQESDHLNFVSLGFGGSIELELSSPVYNTNKNGIYVDNPNSINFGEKSYADLVIVETSYGRMNQNCGPDQDENYPEKIRVFGKQSLLDEVWVELASSECRTSFIDVAPAIDEGLDFVQYIRIVDITDPARHNQFADGYDVDGVIICPDEVVAAITGEGRSGSNTNSLVNARTEESQFELNHEFINKAPNEVLPMEIQMSIYPNPVVDRLNFMIGESWNEAAVNVLNVSGQLVLNGNISTYDPGLNIETLKTGTYIVQLHLNGRMDSRTFVVR